MVEIKIFQDRLWMRVFRYEVNIRFNFNHRVFLLIERYFTLVFVV